MKSRRFFSLCLVLALLMGLVSGCSATQDKTDAPNTEEAHSEAHEKIHSILKDSEFYYLDETEELAPYYEMAAERKEAILNSPTEIVKSDEFIPGETYMGTAYYVSPMAIMIITGFPLRQHGKQQIVSTGEMCRRAMRYSLSEAESIDSRRVPFVLFRMLPTPHMVMVKSLSLPWRRRTPPAPNVGNYGTRAQMAKKSGITIRKQATCAVSYWMTKPMLNVCRNGRRRKGGWHWISR